MLAVIAFAVRQADEPLLEDGVALIPEGERQAKLAVVFAIARQSIFAPAVGAATSVIVRQIIPGRSAGAIVFAHGAPLTLANVGAPLAPGLFAAIGLVESLLFGGHFRGGCRPQGGKSPAVELRSAERGETLRNSTP